MSTHLANALHNAAMGRCVECRRAFVFNPELVPSLKVTRKGRHWRVDEKRGQREPICRDCVTLTNERLQQKGFLPLPILPGCYLGYIKPRKLLSESMPEIIADTRKLVRSLAANPAFRQHMRELLTGDRYQGYEKFRAALPLDEEAKRSIEWLEYFGVDVEKVLREMFAEAAKAGVV